VRAKKKFVSYSGVFSLNCHGIVLLAELPATAALAVCVPQNKSALLAQERRLDG
jgi:hypothetical protein